MVLNRLVNSLNVLHSKIIAFINLIIWTISFLWWPYFIFVKECSECLIFFLSNFHAKQMTAHREACWTHSIQFVVCVFSEAPITHFCRLIIPQERQLATVWQCAFCNLKQPWNTFSHTQTECQSAACLERVWFKKKKKRLNKHDWVYLDALFYQIIVVNNKNA